MNGDGRMWVQGMSVLQAGEACGGLLRCVGVKPTYTHVEPARITIIYPWVFAFSPGRTAGVLERACPARPGSGVRPTFVLHRAVGDLLPHRLRTVTTGHGREGEVGDGTA